MDAQLYITPKDVWDFFIKNEKRLSEEMVLIAENEDTGYAIYFTEDKGFPLFSVQRDDQKEYEEGAISDDDCIRTAQTLYAKYLYPVTVYQSPRHPGDYEEIDDQQDLRDAIEDEIYEREDTLRLAAQDFLVELFCCNTYPELEAQTAEYGVNFIDEFVDFVCQGLMDEYAISIYRPTWEMNEDTGEEVFSEYPYEHVWDTDDD